MQSDPKLHIEQYKRFFKVIPLIASEETHLKNRQGLMRGTLGHWDLNAANIFVKDNRISTIIDWQGASILPLFFHAEAPQLVDYPGEKQLELPEDFAQMEPGDEKDALERHVESSILDWTYYNATGQVKGSPIHPIHAVYQSPTTRRVQQLIGCAEGSWETSIYPFFQCIWNFLSRLEELDPDNFKWPIGFTQEAIERHEEGSKGYHEHVAFWKELTGFVERDGSVRREHYDVALEYFRTTREEYMLELAGEEKDRFAKYTAWAAR